MQDLSRDQFELLTYNFVARNDFSIPKAIQVTGQWFPINCSRYSGHIAPRNLLTLIFLAASHKLIKEVVC